MVETPSAATQRSRVGPLEVMASKLSPKLDLPRGPGSPSRQQQVQRPWGSNELGILEGQGEGSVIGAQEWGECVKGQRGEITWWTVVLAARSRLRNMMGLI